MVPSSGPARPAEHCPQCGNPLPQGGGPCLECAQTLSGAPVPAKAPAPRLRKIPGYRILRELGSGGMGTVYEAHDERMQRRVALKILSRQLAGSARAEDRFAREAWIAGRLDHPHLVKVYERGEWEDLVYYSMELLDGGSLADVVRNLRDHGADERWGVEFGSRDYVRWATVHIVGAARGLDYAHRQGVVHRDVKPMNLLLSRELRVVKVADFGLAIDLLATRMTTDGKALGTPIYMAPEQILGRSGEIDARVDIYALGVSLFELLTLELPYEGPTQQLYLQAVLTREARRASRLNDRVSRDLEIVIRKALEKSPRDRFPTAAAFADDLENVLSFRPIVAKPPTPPMRAWKWARRRPVHAALAALLVLGLPAVTVLVRRAVEHRQLVKEVRLRELEAEWSWADRNERTADVLAVTSRILELDPEHVGALQARSAALHNLARWTTDPRESASLSGRAVGDLDSILRLRPEASWPHRQRARILMALGREAEARAEEESARRRKHEPPSDEDLYYDMLFANDTGDYRGVVELATHLLVRMPTRSEIVALRAGARERLGEVEPALQDYRLIVAMSSDDVNSYLMLGQALVRTGSGPEGLTYLDRSLEIAPMDAHVHEGLSDALLRLGEQAELAGDARVAADDYRRAEAAARKALEIDPRLPWSHVNLGASLVHQATLGTTPDREKIAEGVARYEQALQLWRGGEEIVRHQAYAAALVNLCDARIFLGDLPRALESCQQAATEVGPVDPVAYYNLAAVHALMGRPDDAFRELEKYYEGGKRNYEYLLSDPWLESLRNDPRFKALVQKMQRASRRGR